MAAMRENELDAGLLCECDLATVREINASLEPWFKKYCSKFYALRVDVELIGGATGSGDDVTVTVPLPLVDLLPGGRARRGRPEGPGALGEHLQ